MPGSMVIPFLVVDLCGSRADVVLLEFREERAEQQRCPLFPSTAHVQDLTSVNQNLLNSCYVISLTGDAQSTSSEKSHYYLKYDQR